MSRVGKKPLVIPEKAKVKIENGIVFAEGPKGKTSYALPSCVNAELKDSILQLSLDSKAGKEKSAIFGTTRARINNMLNGVVIEFTKVLEINGVGFKGAVQGQKVTFSLGFSHPVIFDIPQGMTLKFDPKGTVLSISHFDKELVGHFAAKIKRTKPPEPYKGTGIKYQGEHIIRKAGKTAAGVGAKK